MTVTLAAVGDFMLQSRPGRNEVERVRTLLDGADITVANMDTVLSPLGEPTPKLFNLRGPREATGEIAAMGFDAVTIANNHAMDFGPDGMLDMIAAFQASGVTPLGGGKDLAAATAPHIFTAGGRTIALLSIATTLPTGAPAGPGRPGIAPVSVHQSFFIEPSIMSEQPGSVPEVKCWLDETELKRAVADVKAAKQQAEIVVPFLHWGVPSPWRAPFHAVVQKHQRTLGHTLIDAGADAVIGSHAHELHGIEFYNGKPIAYCLGNFWIDGISNWAWMGRESMVLRLSFPPEGNPEVEIQTVWLDDGGWPIADPDHKAVPLLNALSKEDGVSVSPNGDRFRVAANS
jgi:poly-gamma-glutamate synthesis protein (capsule biosynthesis protein)